MTSTRTPKPRAKPRPKARTTRKARPPAPPVGPPDLATLPGRLRHARELSGLSTRALGAAAGLSAGTVSALELSPDGDGARVGNVAALARVLDCHPAWLAFGVGAPPKGAAPK